MCQDLIVGETIDVLGREIVIYDCDDFTRSFYRSYMGLEQDVGVTSELQGRVP